MTDQDRDDCTCPDCLAEVGAAMRAATADVIGLIGDYDFSANEALCVLAGTLGITLGMAPVEDREALWSAALGVLTAAEDGIRAMERGDRIVEERIKAGVFVHEAGTA